MEKLHLRKPKGDVEFSVTCRQNFVASTNILLHQGCCCALPEIVTVFLLHERDCANKTVA